MLLSDFRETVGFFLSGVSFSCSVVVTFGFVLRQDRSPTIEMVINELLQWLCKYKVFGDLINEP